MTSRREASACIRLLGDQISHDVVGEGLYAALGDVPQDWKGRVQLSQPTTSLAVQAAAEVACRSSKALEVPIGLRRKCAEQRCMKLTN